MKKFLKLGFLFCFVGVIMSGCGNIDAPPTPLTRVVTRVDISCRREHMLIQRHYTDMEKMESVLLYLRLLKPMGKPGTDPDRIHKDVYEITVHLSDGNKRIYRQKAHRYFSANARPWKMIDPEQAAGLYTLMRKLPSDSELPVTTS